LILGVAVVCADLATTSHPHEVFFYDLDSELAAALSHAGVNMSLAP